MFGAPGRQPPEFYRVKAHVGGGKEKAESER